MGCTFSSLAFYFARVYNTIAKIVFETTDAIWKSLHEQYMPIPNRNQWKIIADRYEELWNLPNCLGSIDGKHIRIQKMPRTGSENFNYKSFHSLVLMACSDADGNFIMIETGYAGRNSDGGIFKASRMGQWLQQGLDFPEPKLLPRDEAGQNFPHYFVADEAFPLQKYLMRPYPKRRLNNKNRIFNYRLSRGRKSVECSFGMMTQKFQVLLTAIRCKTVKSVNHIIRAVCILPNSVRIREGIPYSTEYDVDEDGEDDTNDRPLDMFANDQEVITLCDRSDAQTLRDYLSQYFLRVPLSWQWKYTINN